MRVRAQAQIHASIYYLHITPLYTAFLNSKTGTVAEMRAHAAVCLHREIACPLTYCGKDSMRGAPIKYMLAHQAVANYRKVHAYLEYVNAVSVEAYCEVAIKPPATVPQKGVSWAFVIQPSDDDMYVVECEYDRVRGAWLVGIVALNIDTPNYQRANILIGNTDYRIHRRVDISIANYENRHSNTSMCGMLANPRDNGISFYEEMVEPGTDAKLSTMRVAVDLLTVGQSWPPYSSTSHSVPQITVRPYAVDRHALPPPPPPPPIVSNRMDQDVAPLTASNANMPESDAATTTTVSARAGDTWDNEIDVDADADADNAGGSNATIPVTTAAMAAMPSSSRTANAHTVEFITPTGSEFRSIADIDSDSESETAALFANATAAVRTQPRRTAAPAANAFMPARRVHRYATDAERADAKRMRMNRLNEKRRDQRAAAARARAAAALSNSENAQTAAVNTAADGTTDD